MSGSDRTITLTVGAPRYVGYIDCFLHTPLVFSVGNGGTEAVTIILVAESADGLIVRYRTQAVIPAEETVKITASDLFSPTFLAKRGETRAVRIAVRLFSGGKELLAKTAEVLALPYGYWEGLGGDAARLAAFVRPHDRGCARVLSRIAVGETAAGERKELGGNRETLGGDAARLAAFVRPQDRGCAKVLSKIAGGRTAAGERKELGGNRETLGGTLETLGNDGARAAYVRPQDRGCAKVLPKIAGGETAAGEKISAAPSPKAIRGIFCALFSEMKRLAPVPAAEEFGKPVAADGADFSAASRPFNRLQAGVFACGCLEAAGLHPVLAVGERRVAVGVWLYDAGFLSAATEDGEVVAHYLARGELAFFETADVFLGRTAGISASEKKFLRALQAGEYRTFVDICRCRAEGVAQPFEAEDGAYADLFRREEVTATVARGRAWERRLLDFSARNPLLNFSAKHTLRVANGDTDGLIAALSSPAGMHLTAGGAPEALALPESELIPLERERKILRVYADEAETAEVAGRLMRAGKEAEEESGAKVLHLAFGLLRGRAGGKAVCAPVGLLPVRLVREPDKTYRLYADGAFFLNSTLTEFLGLKAEGGEPLAEAAFSTPSEACRAAGEAAARGGREVTGETHLCVINFRNYFLWHDLRSNFAEFCKNKTIRALLCGHAEKSEFLTPSPQFLALPLEADASQEEAIALADTGASFVLHGPPGTGKSQTIANMIARALGQGKRTLFIAEKKAALDVVMRRLERIGIGDFCLELNAERFNRAEIACKIQQTLSLSGVEETSDEAEKAFFALKEEADAVCRALNERGRAGFSASEAVSRYLGCGDVPELAGGSSAFYETLTAEKFALVRHALADVERAAKECGDVRGAPFENVGLFAYSEAVRDRVECAARAVLAAGKYMKESAALFMNFYGQEAPVLTEARIRALAALAKRLLEGGDAVYFSGRTAEECAAFLRANDELDRIFAECDRRFKAPVSVRPADREALLRYGAEGGDLRLYPALRQAAKAVARAAGGEPEAVAKGLKLLAEREAAAEKLRGDALAAKFFDGDGEVCPALREEVLGGLRSLRAACREAFGVCDEELFFAACVRGENGSARPFLAGFCAAAEGFLTAFDGFLHATAGERGKIAEEDLPAYAVRKAGAILENIHFLRSRCRCMETARRLEEAGAGDVCEAVNGGRCGAGELVAAFEKGVYRRFIERRVNETPQAGESSSAAEERTEALMGARAAFMEQTRKTLRNFLVRSAAETDAPAERAALLRYARGGARGGSLRGMLAEIPELLSRACPCLLMSPSTAAQLLPPQADAYDLVIFDEASQMSTAEAVGCIARAKATVVVGDGNQLPPTPFFRASAQTEEGEESVLDDLLAIGLPQRRLVWHYRSRHESLIAFSNAAYYNNELRTVPSPDAERSRVKLVRVPGVYGRGESKSNRAEAEALVGEIVSRLSDPSAHGSMGVVTFSAAQKEEIERLLAAELSARGLEERAYAREEPLFVKNLENVQGDERDVILFSVCYGADADGKLSLNFGPLNRAGGWRRLNVAASRAREEMLVYSSISSSAIAAERTASRGVAGLKAFLEYAETGRTGRISRPAEERVNFARHLADAVARLGYACRRGVGASSFRVDVAVRDPRDGKRYLLAILTEADGGTAAALKKGLLEQAGWKVMFVSCVSYYSNPQRELERIKSALDAMTGKREGRMARYARPYRAVAATGREALSFVTEGGNGEKIAARLREIVAREEPISRAFLKKRCLQSFGITAGGGRAGACLDRIIDGCDFPRDRVYGVEYFYKDRRAIGFSRYRTEGRTARRRVAEDFTVYEVVAMVKGALEDNVALYEDEIAALFEREFRARRADGELAEFLLRCVRYGEEKGVFSRSETDKISLAPSAKRGAGGRKIHKIS